VADQSIQRKLAAILYGDVAGYSRLTGADEVGTHEALRTGLAIITKSIESHGGRVINYAGDAVLAEFGSVVECVTTAIEAQEKIAAENDDVAEDKKMLFRIGVHSGEVIIDGTEIYGNDVNIAARLEGLADPGGICLSGLVADQVRHRIDVAIEDLGDKRVKNIENPVRTYRIMLDKKVAQVEQLTRGKTSIAVLPFDNLSGEQEQDYFSDGIAEDIITGLSAIYQLQVVARNSSFSYKGQSPDIRDVAKDLNVHYVLEGSVRKSGNRVRITAQLIDGGTGNHIWADRYDRELKDIFEVQDEITETVIGAIQPAISRAEMERARTKRPENLDAWDLYQRGMYQHNRKFEGSNKLAVSLLQESIKLAPETASAYAGLAYTLVDLARDELSFERIDEAIQAGNKAIELDIDDPAGYFALGDALAAKAANSDGNFDNAILALEHGLVLNPTSVVGHTEVAPALYMIGRAEEAIDHLLTAIRLSPRDLNINKMMSFLACAYFANGNYEATVEWTTKIGRSGLRFGWLAFSTRVSALAHLGREAEAQAELDRLLEQHPKILDFLKNWQASFRDDVVDGLCKAGLQQN
jgi:adenylate cyclase